MLVDGIYTYLPIRHRYIIQPIFTNCCQANSFGDDRNEWDYSHMYSEFTQILKPVCRLI